MVSEQQANFGPTTDGPSVCRAAYLNAKYSFAQIANKQFTDEMLLCPVLVCSLLRFMAVAPCHLCPRGASSVLDSEFVTGSSLRKLRVSHCLLRPGLIPGVNHRGSLTIPTETCNPQRAGTQVTQHMEVFCGLEGRRGPVRC